MGGQWSLDSFNFMVKRNVKIYPSGRQIGANSCLPISDSNRPWKKKREKNTDLLRPPLRSKVDNVWENNSFHGSEFHTLAPWWRIIIRSTSQEFAPLVTEELDFVPFSFVYVFPYGFFNVSDNKIKCNISMLHQGTLQCVSDEQTATNVTHPD